ncbi:MAG: glycosyltransferase [Candidatus Diapherotrites archaeon]
MPEVDISVVVPALNEEKRIARCLESIKAQKFSGSYELIVCDGNSEDKTREIAAKLADKVVVEKKRSIAAERQGGAKEAIGEVIAFTDADAVVPENWLEEIKKEFGKEKGIAMVYGNVFLLDSGGFGKKVSYFLMPKFLSAFVFFGLHNPIGSNMAVKREAFLKVGGFDTSIVTCEDLDLAKKIKGIGKVKYAGGCKVFVSARRIKKMGYPSYVFFHLSNAVKFFLTGKGKNEYEPVR